MDPKRYRQSPRPSLSIVRAFILKELNAVEGSGLVSTKTGIERQSCKFFDKLDRAYTMHLCLQLCLIRESLEADE